MFVKMGTYSRVCVFVEDQGGFGVSIPGKTIFSFGYLNLHPYYTAMYVFLEGCGISITYFYTYKSDHIVEISSDICVR